MNLAEFFRQQIKKWNNENKCGFCWEYDFPLRESDANESRMEDDVCCLKVMITDLSVRDNKTYDPVTGLLTEFNEDYTFTLHVLQQDVLDTDVYKEQLQPINKSKWENILYPIKLCLTGEASPVQQPGGRI